MRQILRRKILSRTILSNSLFTPDELGAEIGYEFLYDVNDIQILDVNDNPIEVIKSEATAPADTTAPVITLVGETSVTLNQSDTFVDPGATTDDGSAITTSGTVDTSTLGTYTVTYDSVDAAGNNATQVTRTVEVIYQMTSAFVGGTDTAYLTNWTPQNPAVAGHKGSGKDITIDVVFTTPADLSLITESYIGLGASDTTLGNIVFGWNYTTVPQFRVGVGTGTNTQVDGSLVASTQYYRKLVIKANGTDYEMYKDDALWTSGTIADLWTHTLPAFAMGGMNDNGSILTWTLLNNGLIINEFTVRLG